jgi:hypothetical protein
MARPAKYNWDAIKKAYESGFTKDDIVKKFKVSKPILTNKINSQKWVVKCDVNADIIELNDKFAQIAQNYTKHPEVAELFEDKINTQMEDNELIKGTRKISKLLLSVIVNKRNEITLKNIRNISGVIKDIESIANPTSSSVKIENNNQNQQAQIQQQGFIIKVED